MAYAAACKAVYPSSILGVASTRRPLNSLARKVISLRKRVRQGRSLIFNNRLPWPPKTVLLIPFGIHN